MTMITNEPWGWHLLLDCSHLNGAAINSVQTIRKFVKAVVQKIDMVPIGDTQVVWCDTHEDVKKGYTFIQIIETSNIIGHLCSYDNTGFIDIWSCKTFDMNDVIPLVREFFGDHETKIRVQFVERIAP